MKTKELQFDGNIYICRIVKSNEGEELLIGSTALLDALHPGSFEDENEGFARNVIASFLLPNKYMTRFSFSPMRKPSNYRTMNSSRN